MTLRSQLIGELRRASQNKSLIVTVGGCVFADDPLLAAAVGADFTSSNGRDAVITANAAVDRLLDHA